MNTQKNWVFYLDKVFIDLSQVSGTFCVRDKLNRNLDSLDQTLLFNLKSFRSDIETSWLHFGNLKKSSSDILIYTLDLSKLVWLTFFAFLSSGSFSLGEGEVDFLRFFADLSEFTESVDSESELRIVIGVFGEFPFWLDCVGGIIA